MTRLAGTTPGGPAIARTEEPDSPPRRLVGSLALFSTGLLAGAFGYGAVNVAQTFKAVPLDVRT